MHQQQHLHPWAHEADVDVYLYINNGYFTSKRVLREPIVDSLAHTLRKRALRCPSEEAYC
jgi:hypothetical protein